MTFRRIVAAVDESEPARHAAERAAQLAAHEDAELVLLHLYETLSGEATTILTATTVDEESRRSAERAMKALTESLELKGARSVVRTAQDIPGAISAFARDEDADLVVVGTIGRTGVARFLMGSVAENVARRAECPVWVERRAGPVLRDVERVVVCTDLSEMSEAGIALASDLAKDLGVAVEIVHALEERYRALSIETQRRLTAEVEKKLARLAGKHFEERPPRLTVTEGANIVDAITAHATRTSTDLLVLATHGRTGMSRVLMGSVAERVMRFAPCSVLVARSPVAP
jgi:nucleotide-binding universal stress UspA family protein